MKKFIFIAAVCLLIISCSDDESQLDRTIFIPDEFDSNLPAYSEWGYNIFGAKYERFYFLATTNIIPCKIAYSNDSIHLMMQGEIRRDGTGREMSLTIIFPFQKIANYKELVALNKKVIDLRTECTCAVTNAGAGVDTLAIVSGELNFKRVQLLSIDDVVNRVILSGTFEVNYLGADPLFYEKLSNGRFDFGITANEFYSHP